MKNITIIGGSAGVGLKTVIRALENGNKVTTLSRTTEKFSQHPNLLVVKGSATVFADVKNVVDKADVIIVTVGTGSKIGLGTIFKRTTLYTDTAIVLLKTLKELEIQVPLIVVTGYGAGNSKIYMPFPLKVILRILLRKIYNNKTLMENLISSNYSNWLIVRPGILTNDDGVGNYKTYDSYEQIKEIAGIPRDDVAQFLVDQSGIENQPGKYIILMGSNRSIIEK